METAFWIIACIVLCFIAGHKQTVINNLKRHKQINDQKDKLIKLQKETIVNQNQTIKYYKEILANGIRMN
jgi:hypothetical protein